MSYDFDFAVIGGGPAGISAACRAAQLGRSVALIEKSSQLGGAGVHAGVLPSKTMWRAALNFVNQKRNHAGYRVGQVEADFSLLKQRVKQVSDGQVSDWGRQIDSYAPTSASTEGSITRFHGEARFVTPHSVEVRSGENTEQLSFEFAVIATGSRPRQLPKCPSDGECILTSDEIFALEKFPESLVIVGAGVIGCEFATIFGAFGKTEVHLIDRADRILPFEDEDIAKICADQLKAKGVLIHQEADLVSLSSEAGRAKYSIKRRNGETQEYEVEKALISIGRVPNSESLGLEEIGVEVDKSGSVINQSTRTNLNHIFAVGDVTKDINLVNVGQTEAVFAVELACGERKGELNYNHISSIMFLDPACASVGLNELQAQQQNIPYRVGIYSFNLVPRSRILGETTGFMKVLVRDNDELIPIGMRAIGPRASELIEPIALLICSQQSMKQLADMVHPHPSSTEGLQDLARMLEGRSLFTPQAFSGLEVRHWHPA